MICKCGCGQEIVIKYWHRQCNIPRFIHGHSGRGKPGYWAGKKRPEISGENHWLFGRHHSEETKRKQRESNIGNPVLSGKKSPHWKGGCSIHWHEKAWEIFGKENCEKCGKSNKDEIEEIGKRLHMHCTSIPKDYTLMISDNWKTVCTKCHARVEDKV
jgi:hypothetical protein